jgi:hypothetical protein
LKKTKFLLREGNPAFQGQTKYHHQSTPKKEVETEVQSMFHLSSLLYSAIPRMKD